MSSKKKIRKIAFWSVILLLCLLFFNIEVNPTPEMVFRQKEMQNLIGPATILETLDFENSSYDHIMIGESNYGYSFFEWNDPYQTSGTLSYQPKGERATLFCTEFMYESLYRETRYLPIFAFAEHSAATSAKLTFTFELEKGTSSLTLEAERTSRGYFLFEMFTDQLLNSEDRLVQILILDPTYGSFPEGIASAQLQLYDRTGNLVETVTFTQ